MEADEEKPVGFAVSRCAVFMPTVFQCFTFLGLILFKVQWFKNHNRES